MAAEKISYTKDYIGTYADMATIDKTEVVPGSTYWAYDTKAAYIFAAGDWRAM
jgi:hypothetical protein